MIAGRIGLTAAEILLRAADRINHTGLCRDDTAPFACPADGDPLGIDGAIAWAETGDHNQAVNPDAWAAVRDAVDRDDTSPFWVTEWAETAATFDVVRVLRVAALTLEPEWRDQWGRWAISPRPKLMDPFWVSFDTPEQTDVHMRLSTFVATYKPWVQR